MDVRSQKFYEWYQQGFTYGDIAKLWQEQEQAERPLSKQRVKEILSEIPGFEPRSISESKRLAHANKHLFYNEYNSELKKIILDLIASGLSVETIADYTDRSIEFINELITSPNKIYVKESSLSPEQQAKNKKVLELYFDKEKFINEISKELNISQLEVVEILQASDRPLRTKGQDTRIRKIRDGRIISEKIALEAIEAKTKGKSYTKFAKERGLSYPKLMVAVEAAEDRVIKKILNRLKKHDVD